MRFDTEDMQCHFKVYPLINLILKLEYAHSFRIHRKSMHGHNIKLRKKKHGTIDGMRRCENETHLAGRVTEWAKATNLMIAWASAGAHGPFPAPAAPLRPVGRR
jgi:hypothetical protein